MIFKLRLAQMHTRPRELFDLIAVALVCCTALLGCSEPLEDPLAFATDVVRLAPLIDSVLATGTIHTVTSIEVSSQLSGRVDEVGVDFNDKVSAGQPLATLDRQRFESKVTELRAGLAVARAEVAAAEAAVEGAVAELEDAERDFSRKEALFAKGSNLGQRC
jgi:HlyD family secretion protein